MAKRGRECCISILTNEQRMWLDVCKKYKDDSLIPTDIAYARYKKRFKKACIQAGLTKDMACITSVCSNR